MQNLCLFILGKKQTNENDVTGMEIVYSCITLRHFIPVCPMRLGEQECRVYQQAVAVWNQCQSKPSNAPAGPLHYHFRAPEAVKPWRCSILVSLQDIHRCSCLNRLSAFSSLSFGFHQNLFSGVQLWHCGKAFCKHLNSFPCDKNHGCCCPCLVAAWHFPKRPWDALLAFLIWNKAGCDVQS